MVDINHPRYGSKHTDRTKKLIGDKARKRLANPHNHPLFGVPMKQSTKDLIGKANLGSTHSKEARKKMSASRTGIAQSDSHKKAIANGRTIKAFEITHPDGTLEVVLNLCKFCKERGLHEGSMYRASRGERNHHRNYIVKEIVNG